MSYDIAAKAVLTYAKETLLRYFVQLDPEQVELLEEIPQETVTLRRSDFPMWIRTREGEERIVVLEFQTRWQADVPLRLAEYVIRFRLRHRMRAQGIVIVFLRREGIPEVYEDEDLRFRYKVVRLWEMSAQACLATEEYVLYPFIPLMSGTERTYWRQRSNSTKAIWSGVRSRIC